MRIHLLLIRKPLLFLFAFFLFSSTGIAQSEKCAFDQIFAEKQQDPNFVKTRIEMEKFIQRYTKNKGTDRSGVAIIPCVVHVVHTGQGPGTIDNDQSGNNDGANPNDPQINSAISNMTDAFKHTGPYAPLNGYTATLNVTFVLAKTAPDGSATSGIIRHNVSGESWGTDYANNGMDAGQTPGVPQATITAGKYWPPMDYMNIWIVHEVENATTTLGFASFPNANAGGTDGLTMLATAFGYDPNCGTGSALPGSILDCGTNLNGTANHETGHYLNLFHTFTGDGGGSNCPADNTCGTDSDCCADIPAHKRTSGCPADDPTGNDCPSPGSGPNSYIHNFMDYADDACFHGFSENQKTRMEAALI